MMHADGVAVAGAQRSEPPKRWPHPKVEPWGPPVVTALIAEWEAGRSIRTISRSLSARFSREISRDAVGKKARRLNLQIRGNPIATQPPAKPKPPKPGTAIPLPGMATVPPEISAVASELGKKGAAKRWAHLAASGPTLAELRVERDAVFAGLDRKRALAKRLQREINAEETRLVEIERAIIRAGK